MEKLSFSYLKGLFDRYERHLSSFALVFGFIFDNLTLRRVDFVLDNIIIISYLLITGVCIIVINLYEEGKLRGGAFDNFYDIVPFLMQFAFGGLFSAFVVFYSRSASVFSSLPFVLILVGLLIGNEFLRTRYLKLIFQVGVYFVGIFSFLIFFLPVLTKKIGAGVFLGSGVISLLFISFFILILSLITQSRFKESKKSLILVVSGLFIFINFLYFTNIIPPIPLSLKKADVYHMVQRNADGTYLVSDEDNERWYDKFIPSQKIHLRGGEGAYVFSSVFAPTDLDTKIVHDWQYFDEGQDKWISSSKIKFSIIGGRDSGFRGFSKKEILWEGKWRVDIKTEREQVIGRVRFDIERPKTTIPLKNVSL